VFGSVTLSTTPITFISGSTYFSENVSFASSSIYISRDSNVKINGTFFFK
jgi:hypothetical protein